MRACVGDDRTGSLVKIIRFVLLNASASYVSCFQRSKRTSVGWVPVSVVLRFTAQSEGHSSTGLIRMPLEMTKTLTKGLSIVSFGFTIQRKVQNYH